MPALVRALANIARIRSRVLVQPAERWAMTIAFEQSCNEPLHMRWSIAHSAQLNSGCDG
jgi:hypothetical protein